MATAAVAQPQQPPGFPVAVKALSVQVAGVPTDIVASKYEDGLLLVVSQIGAFGTIIRARWVGGRCFASERWSGNVAFMGTLAACVS
jgi:hypothetical protein